MSFDRKFKDTLAAQVEHLQSQKARREALASNGGPTDEANAFLSLTQRRSNAKDKFVSHAINVTALNSETTH